MIATREQCDRGMAALTLWEAVAGRNHANIYAVTKAFEPAELVTGLVTVVDSLLLSLAAQSGSPLPEVVEALRASLLTYGDEQ